jgi:hypothetical protein
MIDDVLYGFAGTNAIFKIFLQMYTIREQSEFILDTAVELAKKNRVQFFIIKHDEENGLKLFAYSPGNDNNPEIFRISSDPIIDKNCYAIGSGKHSKEYKKHKLNKNAQMPILKIITANNLGLKKKGMLHLSKGTDSGELTLDESREAYLACHSKGGDLFTGGEISMSTSNISKTQIVEQITILDRMDQEAKQAGAVCSSPVNAAREVDHLKSIGQYSISPYKVEVTCVRNELLNKMQAILDASI